jgi:excisionase family DNA binding protein
MTEMLTAKEMQHLLQVDRSTIYRMAEARRLPAVKVGKQWRFPADLVESWLAAQTEASTPAPALAVLASPGDVSSPEDFASTLPLDCVQLILDAFAQVLDVTLVVTDLDGRPITQVSNPFPFFNLLSEAANGHAICRETWRELGQVPALEPHFRPGFGGLLCARALVRVGSELKGMVIVFGVAPRDWPPSHQATQDLAASLNISPDKLSDTFDSVFTLTPDQERKVLVTIQRIADILAHIGSERTALLGRLKDIAKLSTV